MLNNGINGTVPKVFMINIRQPSSKLPIEIVRHLNRRKRGSHHLQQALSSHKIYERSDTMDENIFAKKEARLK